jgi:soluble cytochrome b562
MKYFKFLGDSTDWGWNKNPVTNEVYSLKKLVLMYGMSHRKVEVNEDFILPILRSENWQEVPKRKKTLSEKIEQLKKQAESEGMKLEVVLEKKVKKRVKVDPNVRSIQEGFEILANKSDKNDFLNWMSSKLEEYLNR